MCFKRKNKNITRISQCEGNHSERTEYGTKTEPPTRQLSWKPNMKTFSGFILLSNFLLWSRTARIILSRTTPTLARLRALLDALISTNIFNVQKKQTANCIPLLNFAYNEKAGFLAGCLRFYYKVLQFYYN